MRPIHLLCFFIWAVLSVGCNPKPESQKPANVPATSQTTVPDSIKRIGGHDYTFLTYKMLLYRNSVIMGQDPKEQPYAGHWIKMDPDGTYKAGKYKDQTHTGKWTYNHDAGVILFQSDDNNFKPEEWKVMYNDDMVVFIGTGTYGNSGTQIQLVRIDKFPEPK